MSPKLLPAYGVLALLAPPAHACSDCDAGANGDPIVLLMIAISSFLVLRAGFRALVRWRRNHAAPPAETASDPETQPPK